MMTELKPCPKCGNKAELHEGYSQSQNGCFKKCYYYKCTNCCFPGVEPHFEPTKTGARLFWEKKVMEVHDSNA